VYYLISIFYGTFVGEYFDKEIDGERKRRGIRLVIMLLG
jgi:hypothetical protein